MEITADSFKEQIPYYLTREQKDGFLKALKDFPDNINYYIDKYQDELLQGDGWTKLQLKRLNDDKIRSILGIIISNTCDVAAENKRDLPTNITFAPIIPLEKYVTLLGSAKIGHDKIKDKVASIKQQKITNIFFLPACDGLKEDHIALLDQIFTMPSDVFQAEKERSKPFTLSLTGFYLFIFKLSVHFCRFGENVTRN